MEEEEEGLYVIRGAVQKEYANLLEVNEFHPELKPLKAMVQELALRKKLALTRRILPVLTVKQSDVESSKLAGLKQGLNFMESYLRPKKMVLVVTNASKRLTALKVRQTIRRNHQWLNQ